MKEKIEDGKLQFACWIRGCQLLFRRCSAFCELVSRIHGWRMAKAKSEAILDYVPVGTMSYCTILVGDYSIVDTVLLV